MSARILLVEDEAALRDSMQKLMARRGFEVLAAASAEDGLDLLEQQPFDLVIADVGLPGSTGIDLLTLVKARYPFVPVIVMTASEDPAIVVEALHGGADRYIIKPFDAADLEREIRTGLERGGQLKRRARDRAALESQLREQEDQSRTLILRGARSLVQAVEAKDAYTMGHSHRVMEYAGILAGRAGGFDLTNIRLGAELHDIGKIGIPDAVLNKPGRLTEREFSKIREHPGMGRRILEPLIEQEEILAMTLCHHERWDGAGYPMRLAGGDIPNAARLLAVADTLDAVTSWRAYRDARSWELAVIEVRSGRGKQFEPAAVDVFEEALPELEAAFKQLHS